MKELSEMMVIFCIMMGFAFAQIYTCQHLRLVYFLECKFPQKKSNIEY